MNQDFPRLARKKIATVVKRNGGNIVLTPQAFLSLEDDQLYLYTCDGRDLRIPIGNALDIKLRLEAVIAQGGKQPIRLLTERLVCSYMGIFTPPLTMVLLAEDPEVSTSASIRLFEYQEVNYYALAAPLEESMTRAGYKWPFVFSAQEFFQLIRELS